mmetsp:Transcript_5019/g.12795  ORF Transcript_5019/g.12795 Transcript_5019/m.12795 type:complete len:305 (+) Transcript_5019:85-999(+)
MFTKGVFFLVRLYSYNRKRWHSPWSFRGAIQGLELLDLVVVELVPEVELPQGPQQQADVVQVVRIDVVGLLRKALLNERVHYGLLQGEAKLCAAVDDGDAVVQLGLREGRHEEVEDLAVEGLGLGGGKVAFDFPERPQGVGRPPGARVALLPEKLLDHHLQGGGVDGELLLHDPLEHLGNVHGARLRQPQQVDVEQALEGGRPAGVLGHVFPEVPERPDGVRKRLDLARLGLQPVQDGLQRGPVDPKMLLRESQQDLADADVDVLLPSRQLLDKAVQQRLQHRRGQLVLHIAHSLYRVGHQLKL